MGRLNITMRHVARIQKISGKAGSRESQDLAMKMRQQGHCRKRDVTEEKKKKKKNFKQLKK